MLAVNKNNHDIHQLSDLTNKRLTPMAPSGGLFSILKQYNKSHKEPINIDTIQAPSNGDNLKWLVIIDVMQCF